MTVIFVVLPLTLLLSSAAVAAFLWATRTGQLDDLETPALRLLNDEARPALVPESHSGRPESSAAIRDLARARP